MLFLTIYFRSCCLQLLYGNEFFRIVFAGSRLEAYCFCLLVLSFGFCSLQMCCARRLLVVQQL